MINLVQNMYKPRDITNFKTAKTALDLLTSANDSNTCQTRFTTITQITTKKQINNDTLNNRKFLLYKELLTKLSKVINQPDKKKTTRSQYSEMPSFEVIIKRRTTDLFYSM